MKYTNLATYNPAAFEDPESLTEGGSLPVYRQHLTALVGQGEAGKTWIAAHVVLTAARIGWPCLVLDGEMSLRAWHSRLLALGADREAFEYINYAEMGDDCTDVEKIARLLYNEIPGTAMVVWDSALSMLSRTARSENDNAEVARVYDRIREIVRRCNVAGLIVDHTTRGSDQLISRGATAKFNALDLSYGVRLAEGTIPSPDEEWSSVVTVEKDRHGLLGKRRDREVLFVPLGAGRLEIQMHEVTGNSSRLATDKLAPLVAQIAALDPPPTSGNEAHRQLGGTRAHVLAAYRRYCAGGTGGTGPTGPYRRTTSTEPVRTAVPPAAEVA